jgi:hypothetical protein
LIKIGDKILRHSQYVLFPLAEVVVLRQLFARILGRISHSCPPVPRVEVGPLRQTSPKAVAGRPRGAARGDFEVYVAEKSRLWRLRGLVKRGQEFIRVRYSLLRTVRRSTLGRLETVVTEGVYLGKIG